MYTHVHTACSAISFGVRALVSQITHVKRISSKLCPVNIGYSSRLSLQNFVQLRKIFKIAHTYRFCPEERRGEKVEKSERDREQRTNRQEYRQTEGDGDGVTLLY